jgi:hypothetical protein
MSVNNSQRKDIDQKLYKFQFNSQKNTWEVTERRLGGEVEQKLFNRFGADENTYYQAASNLRQAEAYVSSSQGQEFLANYRQLAKTERIENEQRDPVELRRERWSGLEKEVRDYTFISTGKFDERESVMYELYYVNQMVAWGVAAKLAYNSKYCAEIAYEFYLEEEEGYNNANFSRQKREKGAHKLEGRDEIVSYEFLDRLHSSSAKHRREQEQER